MKDNFLTERAFGEKVIKAVGLPLAKGSAEELCHDVMLLAYKANKSLDLDSHAQENKKFKRETNSISKNARNLKKAIEKCETNWPNGSVNLPNQYNAGILSEIKLALDKLVSVYETAWMVHPKLPLEYFISREIAKIFEARFDSKAGKSKSFVEFARMIFKAAGISDAQVSNETIKKYGALAHKELTCGYDFLNEPASESELMFLIDIIQTIEKENLENISPCELVREKAKKHF